MKRDDDPELWDLLSHAAEPEVSPFFARNVLRKVLKPSRWSLFRQRFHLPKLIPAASVATIVLTALFLRWSFWVTPLATVPSDRPIATTASEYEVISDVDELLAVDDSNSLEEGILL